MLKRYWCHVDSAFIGEQSLGQKLFWKSSLLLLNDEFIVVTNSYHCKNTSRLKTMCEDTTGNCVCFQKAFVVLVAP